MYDVPTKPINEITDAELESVIENATKELDRRKSKATFRLKITSILNAVLEENEATDTTDDIMAAFDECAKGR